MGGFKDAGPGLTGPVTGDEYMQVLLERQRAWMDEHPGNGRLPQLPPLLEWFIRDEDEPLVRLP